MIKWEFITTEVYHPEHGLCVRVCARLPAECSTLIEIETYVNLWNVKRVDSCHTNITHSPYKYIKSTVHKLYTVNFRPHTVSIEHWQQTTLARVSLF